MPKSPSPLNSPAKRKRGWSKGFIAQRKQEKEDERLILWLTNPQFLQETANRSTSAARLEHMQTMLSQCNACFSSSQYPVDILTRIFFCPTESRVGLLGLSATKTGGDMNVSYLVEQIMEVLMTQGWFKSIITFKNFHHLQYGRTSLLSSEVIDWIYRTGGIIDMIEKRSNSAVLLLYFFLSIDYEGSPQVWNSLRSMGSDTIKSLCQSLVEFLLRGTIGQETESVALLPLVYHLLKQIVDYLKWYTSDEDTSSDQVIQTLRAFTTKYAIAPQPTLFLPPRSTETFGPTDNASNEKPIDAPIGVGAWEERFFALERMITEERLRNDRLEAQLQESVSVISSLQSLLSRKPNFDIDIENMKDEPIDSLRLPKPMFSPKESKEIQEEEDVNSTNVSHSTLASNFGLGKEWSGFSHPNCASPDSYAVLQREDGNYTIINKSSGRGYIALSVGHDPKVIVDPEGNMGVGINTPRAKLHVDGTIRLGQSSFAMTSLENLTVVRGGFSCRTFEPKRGPGWLLQDLKRGMIEIQFVHPFTKRPSVIAIQNIPQQSPTLLPVGYVDASKFGFLAGSSKTENWIEFFVFGQRASGWL